MADSSLTNSLNSLTKSASDILNDCESKITQFLTSLNESTENYILYKKKYEEYILNHNYDGSLMKEKMKELLIKIGAGNDL